jgi:nitrite reductase/ring-hydroxylating ferredoxin subunit
MAQFQLASVEDVPENSMRVFEAGGQRVLVVNLNGSFHALDDLCPHLSVPMSRGEIKEGCVVCPGHASAFDLKTGTAIRWIGKPITWLTKFMVGRPVNARVYHLTVEDGKLLVEV